MIERHSVSGAPAAIVPDDVETLETQVAHDPDLIRRERAEGVVGTVVQTPWLGGLAIAAQIGTDNREPPSKLRRNLRPHAEALGKAMKHENGWT
jgi:hypothetical protein